MLLRKKSYQSPGKIVNWWGWCATLAAFSFINVTGVIIHNFHLRLPRQHIPCHSIIFSKCAFFKTVAKKMDLSSAEVWCTIQSSPRRADDAGVGTRGTPLRRPWSFPVRKASPRRCVGVGGEIQRAAALKLRRSWWRIESSELTRDFDLRAVLRQSWGKYRLLGIMDGQPDLVGEKPRCMTKEERKMEIWNWRGKEIQRKAQ